MLRIILIVFTAAAVLSSCSEKAAVPGRAFEGKIIQKITINGGAIAAMAHEENDSADGAEQVSSALRSISLKADLIMYVKPDKLSYEVSMLGGLVSIRTIIDPLERSLIMLSPDKKAYKADLRSLDSAMQADPEEAGDMLDSLLRIVPKPTGKKDEINGFDCEQYVMHIDDAKRPMDIDMWITSDSRLKFYDVIRNAVLGRRNPGSGPMAQVFAAFRPVAGPGKVPVKMTIRSAGVDLLKSELTEMIEEKLDDKLFVIPEGYRIVEQSADSVK